MESRSNLAGITGVPMFARLLITLGFLLAAGLAHAAERERIVGGPCDGCELVFVGMPEEIGEETRIAAAGELGEAMRIEGRVTDAAGTPQPGIIVYAYHTDAAGVYPRGDTRHGQLRGWVRSNAAGEYRFDTMRPGSYPNSRIPQHVHLHVIEPGRVTYYIDDILFDDDPHLSDRQRKSMLSGRGGEGLAKPVRDADGVWQVRRDIVLGRGIADYP